MITSTNRYVPVVTLYINDNIKFLEHLKQVFNITILWNKYRSEITLQPRNNHFGYMLDLPIRNINRLFVLLSKAVENDLMRNSIVKYYIPLAEIKDLNVLIVNKLFFKQLAKNKQEAYEKPVKMSRINDYITRNLLDYYYKLIGIDLSRQTNTT